MRELKTKTVRQSSHDFNFSPCEFCINHKCSECSLLEEHEHELNEVKP